jgi:hypothetical protein
MKQVEPVVGCMLQRHGLQIGSREMLVRGSPQSRQSKGKTAEKKLSATRLVDETRIDRSQLPGVTTSVPVARIGSPLLLKTGLPHLPAVAELAASESLSV